ncbi:MAG: choice-of-anchor B family protein [Caldilineaceae bacterium]
MMWRRPAHTAALLLCGRVTLCFTDGSADRHRGNRTAKWLHPWSGLTAAANRGNTPTALFNVPCVDGFADVFPCKAVDLLAYLPIAEIGGHANNDAWGWRDPLDGTEYALVGAHDGVIFLDISRPTAPRYLGKLPSHGTISSWRDLKVYQDYLFVVADYNANHGMQSL